MNYEPTYPPSSPTLSPELFPVPPVELLFGTVCHFQPASHRLHPPFETISLLTYSRVELSVGAQDTNVPRRPRAPARVLASCALE